MNDDADAGPDPTVPPESRRDRHRRELTTEIIAIARRQLTEGGRAGVSWRAIAREVGMNPASLYTYFANLDELFTAMIIESYQGLAQTVDGALDRAIAETGEAADPNGRPSIAPLCAVVRAYHRWAVENPAQYNLIFTDQIPGYAAPAEGPTIEAEIAVIDPLVRALGLAIGRRYTTDDYADVPPGPMARWLRTWGVLHGLVSLEINNHLPFVEDPAGIVVEAVIAVVEDES